MGHARKQGCKPKPREHCLIKIYRSFHLIFFVPFILAGAILLISSLLVIKVITEESSHIKPLSLDKKVTSPYDFIRMIHLHLLNPFASSKRKIACLQCLQVSQFVIRFS